MQELLRSQTGEERTRTDINQHSMFLTPINESQVRSIIVSLKHKCSPGLDNINAKDLQLVIDIITPILLDNFNKCLINAEFPDCLKETVIVPIHKDGDKALSNHYRPISNIPTIGKVFEKLINIQLRKFIDNTTKIDPDQFGFQRNSSTDAALCQVIHNINWFLDIGHYVLVLFIDLRKAFDMVDHSVLLEVLRDLG